MRKKSLFDAIPLLLSNLLFFPLSILTMKLFKGKQKPKKEFYGMGVSLDKGSQQVPLIEELGIKHLLIRMPLWEMDRVGEYVEFAKSFGEDKEILINVLQDREHIDDVELLRSDMKLLFEAFDGVASEYQIASTINRTKWGFFSVGEYLKFYQVVQELRDELFPTLTLIGPSVIDFEYHYTIRALFNFFPVKYDKLSALLYVDRRGAPENTQMGIFDTKNKIDMLYSLARLSPKSSDEIYITEVNWPLSGTAPYAPTSELECVSETEYAQYMSRYLEIAKESGKVSRVYWHQLIAAGYGLVDDRDAGLRKMEAFERFKMIKKGN